MITIKYTCQFLLDKEKDKPDAKLRCRVKWEHNTRIVSLFPGYRVDLNKWSPESQRCKNNTTHGKKKVMSSVINREIQRYVDTVDNVFSEFEKEEIVPSSEDMKNRILQRLGKSVNINETLFDRFDEFVGEMSRINEWTPSTMRKMASFKEHLLKFNKKLKFEDFTESGLMSYLDFIMYDLDFRNSTAAKDIANLKWFLRWARRKGYTQTLDFLDFNPKIKQIKKAVIFLEWDELMRLYNYEIPENGTVVRLVDYDGNEYFKTISRKAALERVRDMFCFCCFSSLRYSDVAKLKMSDVYDEYISIVSKKSIDTLHIELNKYSRHILDKYKYIISKNGNALPVMSNQKSNEHIKTLCELCGINRPISEVYYKQGERVEEAHPKYEVVTTHTARKTFIVHSLMMGTPANVVMEWTGHDNYESMKPYIAVANEAKSRYMSMFDKYGIPEVGPTKNADKVLP